MKPSPVRPFQPGGVFLLLFLSLVVILLPDLSSGSRIPQAEEISLLGSILTRGITGLTETEAREHLRLLSQEWPPDWKPVLVPGPLILTGVEPGLPDLPQGVLTREQADILVRTGNIARGQVFLPRRPSDPLIWGRFLSDPEGYLLIIRRGPSFVSGFRFYLSRPPIRRSITFLALAVIWLLLIQFTSPAKTKKRVFPQDAGRGEGYCIALEENLKTAEKWLRDFSRRSALRSPPEPGGTEAQHLAGQMERLRKCRDGGEQAPFLVHECIQNLLLSLNPDAGERQVTLHARYTGTEKNSPVAEPFFKAAVRLLLLALLEASPSGNVITVLVNTGTEGEIRLTGVACTDKTALHAAAERADGLLKTAGGGVTGASSPGGLFSFRIRLPLIT